MVSAVFHSPLEVTPTSKAEPIIPPAIAVMPRPAPAPVVQVKRGWDLRFLWTSVLPPVLGLVFLITVPDGAGDEHLQILASLSRALMKSEFRDTLLRASDPQVVVDTIMAAAAPVPVGAAAAIVRVWHMCCVTPGVGVVAVPPARVVVVVVGVVGAWAAVSAMVVIVVVVDAGAYASLSHNVA